MTEPGGKPGGDPGQAGTGELEKVQEALRQSEQLYRLLVERSVQGIVVLRSGRVVFSNLAFAAISGYSIEELQNLPADGVEALIHEEDRDLVWGTLRRRLAKEPAEKQFEFRGIRKDGSPCWLEMRASMVHFEGEPAVQALFLDITDRKRAEQALQESEARFRELAEMLPETVYEMDTMGRLTFVNRKAFDHFRYTQQDFDQGVNGFEMLIPDDRPRAMQNVKRVLMGEPERLNEYTALRKDGTTFPVMMSSALILRAGEPAGLRGFILDISQRKKMEQDLLRAQKIESLGLLAGGIAHDFHNLLTVILANLSLAKELGPASSELPQLVEDARKASLRARTLTRQLLTFSSGGAPVRRVAQVSEIVREICGFALRGSNVECELQLPDDLWCAEVDSGQIGQVISNLVINGDQAMPDGGVLKVRMENEVVRAESSTPVEPGRCIRIVVEDQGDGISEGNLGQIFDPYFTTKEAGNGLGLSVAYSIVKNHEGHIEVESRPGQGATFTIHLPASMESVCERKDEGEGPIPGSGRLLLMDDEPDILEIAGRSMEKLGYTVDLAMDGEEAVEAFVRARNEGNPYDLVILDLTVRGGMGGRETLQRLLEIDPQVRAAVSSGYSDDPVLADHRAFGFSGIIPKPYDTIELSLALKEILEAEQNPD